MTKGNHMENSNISEELEFDPYMMRISKSEKLYKIFIFHPAAGKPLNFEYRIITKERKDGLLEMVSYSFKIVDTIPLKMGVMSAKDIAKDKIGGIISGMMQSTNTADDELEIIDLSIYNTFEEQIKYLQKEKRTEYEWIM
jgi:hypothetical protein